MRYLNLILVLLLTACGKASEEVNKLRLEYVEEELKPYVISFYLEGLKRNKEVNVEGIKASVKTVTNKYGERVVGVCFMGQKSLEVDKEYWSYASYNEKENLMFHELGHCLLLRNHSESYNSIMYSTMLSSNFYEDNRVQLLNELFN